MDIVAVAQNLSCNIEKAMGIYPNVPRLHPADPTEPHWCGPRLDSATYRVHEGHCGDHPLARIRAEQTAEHDTNGAEQV